MWKQKVGFIVDPNKALVTEGVCCLYNPFQFKLRVIYTFRSLWLNCFIKYPAWVVLELFLIGLWKRGDIDMG